MNNKIIATLVLTAIVLVGTVYYYEVNNVDTTQGQVSKVILPKDMVFKVDNAPAKYFGNEAVGDLDHDGVEDIAFLITYDGGGSGTFYYAIVALKKADGYVLTNPFLVGDRIAPQSTYIPKNSMELQVNYAERKKGEPMTTQPSQGATLLLKVTKQGVLEGLMK